jgi:hypothetical protein
MIIGLNPSTADETVDDPTIGRCIDFARSWGYGGLCMANLFSYRATKPAVMLNAEEPVGLENDAWLLRQSKKAGVVVAAWGNHGSHRGRSKEATALIPNLHYLKLNATGEPRHPLYLKRDLKPMLMSI